MKKIIQQYQQEGYYLAKNAFSKEFIQNLINHLSTLTPKVTLPFTNVPWGYGNLIDEGPFTQIGTDKNVVDFCKNVLGDKYKFNHLFVHNKAPFVGASIEWHQEIFNHLLVHGSASNASNRSRKAIVLQGRNNIKEKNDKIFEKESQYRTNFVVKGLTNRINKLTEKNIYLDSHKK